MNHLLKFHRIAHSRPSAARTAGRRQSARTKAELQSSLRWMWLLSGVLVGILISASLFIKLSKNQSERSTTANPPIENERGSANQESRFNAKPPQAQAEKEEMPRFDFYNMLSKPSNTAAQERNSFQKESKPNTHESQNSMDESKSSATESNRNSTLNLATLNEYYIQVGSFQNLTDANELKAKLILTGFDSSIDTVQFQNGQTWYRVRVGPFDSEKFAVKQQKVLNERKIHGTLVLKRK